ncbi:MAG: 3-dehydroquinate synthase [Clostridiales bacterium]|jgi:3-dehydroquinate synthase|nr:3-dehydroquinate synthase [Clostridiales bacterium]
MEKIRVNAGAGYDVLIAPELLRECGRLVKEILPGAKKLAVVCDDTVDGLYSERVMRSLEGAGLHAVKYVFPHGEAHKNSVSYVKLLEFLSAERLSRTDAAIALGGGVTGDLTGFAAATYLRGISFFQAPTTLLAAVDSSVGGKTGINLPQGKNLAGCFHQPSAVICDTDTLKTLPPDVMADGMGEVVKHAVLDGGELLAELNRSGERNWEKIIALNVRIKSAIVERDEREENIRKFLNLGHTVGHAIEKLSGYSVSHGKCVAAGVAYIAELSLKKGFLNAAAYGGIINLLKQEGFKTACPYNAKELSKIILSDKKIGSGRLTFVMMRDIGDCFLHGIETDKIEEFLRT